MAEGLLSATMSRHPISTVKRTSPKEKLGRPSFDVRAGYSRMIHVRLLAGEAFTASFGAGDEGRHRPTGAVAVRLLAGSGATFHATLWGVTKHGRHQATGVSVGGRQTAAFLALKLGLCIATGDCHRSNLMLRSGLAAHGPLPV